MAVQLEPPPDQKTPFDSYVWQKWFNAVRSLIVNSVGTVTGAVSGGAGVSLVDTGDSTNSNIALKSLVQGSGITLTDSDDQIVISAAGSSGTVTSVGLALPASTFNISGSPVTASGTLTGSFANQAANLVFAGPAAGAVAVPTWRALAAADLPLATTSTAGAVKPDGTTITISAGVISAVGGSGGGPAYAKSLQSGFYVTFCRGSFVNQLYTTGTFAANAARAVPIRVLVACSITPVVYITAAAAGDVLFSLYAVNPATGLPGVKIIDFAQMSTAATGLITSATTYPITPGDYFIFYNQSSAYTGRLGPVWVPYPDWGTTATSLTAGTAMLGRLDFTLTYASTGPATLVGQVYTYNNTNTWFPHFAVT